MTVLSEIQGLFSPHTVAKTIETLPPLKSTVVDTLFPKIVEHQFAVIGIHELETVVGTQPVVRRDGQPIPFKSKGDDVNFYAPRPLKPSVDITASEINDLKVIWGNTISRQAFVARKVDQLRQVVRNSTEGMASVVATTGALAWPSRVEGGGVETYELDFGSLTQVDPAQGWDSGTAPTLKEVYDHLTDLEERVTEDGGGGNLKFLAGKTAFGTLLNLAEKWMSTVQGRVIDLKLENGVIIIGGYEIRRLTERYQSPIDEQWISKIETDLLLGYAQDQPGTVFYLAIDSISNNGQATPFHIVTEPVPGDAAIRLIGQAKPVPSRNTRSLILSQVTNI